ncbi:hypothetical protein K0I04_002588 [Enterococcus faecalis]|nr:hypothetical protein [Enterococcus faecalis]EKJ3873826.1 hypothetical protein [Salmonella enterica subsp. enterica serovar Cerro]EGO8029686.1 hypothetical protein [Enterococcus faecalis]EGO8634323.1 hypothetical protein [Enterococcus faecalis]EGO9274008.1 hypothetical protein [Enterococcus faecalis]
MGLMTGYNMTKEEYEITQAVLTRLDKFETELASLLLDLEPFDLLKLDTAVRDETLRMYNYLSRSYILLLDTVAYKDTLEEDISSGIVKIDGQPLDEEE